MSWITTDRRLSTAWRDAMDHDAIGFEADVAVLNEVLQHATYHFPRASHAARDVHLREPLRNELDAVPGDRAFQKQPGDPAVRIHQREAGHVPGKRADARHEPTDEVRGERRVVADEMVEVRQRH